MAVVQPGMHQGNYQLLECGGRYISADLTQLTRIDEATRHRFLDMHPHRLISVYVDAEIADVLHCSDVDAVNQHSSKWKLMLAPACRAPQTSVLSGLSCSLFDFIQVAVASTHSVTCDESTYTAAGEHEPTPYTWVSSPLVGVKMRRQTMTFNQGDQLHGVQDEQKWSQHRTLRHTADELNDG